MDYTDAADVIAWAFQDRSGRRLEQRELEGPVPSTSPGAFPAVDALSSIPVPIFVLGAMSLTLLAAGGFGYVARRRREQSADVEAHD